MQIAKSDATWNKCNCCDADRERLIRYKFRWAEADEEPQDNQLTISEMQNFRHPEQSSKMIVRMARDIIENLGICLLNFFFYFTRNT